MERENVDVKFLLMRKITKTCKNASFTFQIIEKLPGNSKKKMDQWTIKRLNIACFEKITEWKHYVLFIHKDQMRKLSSWIKM